MERFGQCHFWELCMSGSTCEVLSPIQRPYNTKFFWCFFEHTSQYGTTVLDG